MIVAIMQPYFFPYIGYFQLMSAVDCFVFHDDVQFIKGGWINRNRILISGAPAWWTFPVTKSDHSLTIKERFYLGEAAQVHSMLRRIEGAYRKAPQFNKAFPLISACLETSNQNVAEFNQSHLEAIAKEIGIKCNFLVSSKMTKNNELSAQDRVIDICLRIGATRYINPIGGLDLYDSNAFIRAGLELNFIKSCPTAYAQFDCPHVPFLSILDVLMFNSFEQTAELLNNYEIVQPHKGEPP